MTSPSRLLALSMALGCALQCWAEEPREPTVEEEERQELMEEAPPRLGPADRSRELWIPALNEERIRRLGPWWEMIFRETPESDRHLFTNVQGAELSGQFTGTGLVLIFESHIPYVYRGGGPSAGLLEVWIDGDLYRTVDPWIEADEVVLFRGWPSATREVTLRHLGDAEKRAGVRIKAFRELEEPTSDVSFSLEAEYPDLLVNARFTVFYDERVLRSSIQRNWISGMVRLAALPPGEGYRLRIEALGWEPLEMELPILHPDSERALVPLQIPIAPEVRTAGFESPRPGHPAIKRPGDDLEIRFEPTKEGAEIRQLIWRQREGKAVRRLELWSGKHPVGTEPEPLTVQIPKNWEATGLGDLLAVAANPDGAHTLQAPLSLQIRKEWPERPRFLLAGHLDVWGQYQAESLRQLARMANIIDPDMVLLSNEVNPIYTSGSFSISNVPFLVTIGNHSPGYETNPAYQDAEGELQTGPEGLPFSYSLGETMQLGGTGRPLHALRTAANRNYDRWFGDPVGLLELGPDIAVLNFGWMWDPELSADAIEQARSLLADAGERRILLMNTFQGNVPPAFLGEFPFSVVNAAHGWVYALPLHHPAPDSVTTPYFRARDGTLIFGRSHTRLFWLLEYDEDGELVEFGWRENEEEDSEVQPFAFPRRTLAPLRVEFSAPSEETAEAVLINHLPLELPAARIDWVLPREEKGWTFEGAEMAGRWDSDDGLWTVHELRLPIMARSQTTVRAKAPTSESENPE